MIRALILVLLLGSLGWWLDREHQAGRFQRVDELFLDFLVANARDRFTSADDHAVSSSPVVLVKMRLADKAEYAGWPPRPLDWQMVLKGLQAYNPAVVVVPETLFWGRPSPEFVIEAAHALVPFPSTVLGIESQLAANREAPAFLGGLENSLPQFQKVQGDIGSAPPLGALIAAPDDLIRRQAEIGISVPLDAKDVGKLPYAVQESGHLLPTVLAQALARFTQTPYATQRLLLGPGAGAYLSNGAFVPLSAAGEFIINTKQPVHEVDALHLMTSELADALSPQDKANLSGDKVIVIGTDDDAQSGLARLHAQALAQVLALPRLRLLPRWAQWILWGAAGLAGFWLVLFVPRTKSILRGMLCIFAALVACFLAFQSSLIWCPPTIPASLLAASTVFARLAGRRK
ncbi:MAG: CHASE2 domain-containing protein [Prosthecobacter sp.]|uniref:CHASE2 domain-containing protein n=1 Tax=Prosthecobacter sp. TaxID=1965333 RepID=UPI0025E0D37B|nr:CHASE2 domain-containing protein [Prosthecobacter sp.]MCF7787727.1 CHASE2 domain-containing protein [Prosthecobacter sp.]